MPNYNSPSAAHKPSHGGRPGVVPGLPPRLADPEANLRAIEATTPTTSCPCGQVPVCHGLEHCGIDSVRMRD